MGEFDAPRATASGLTFPFPPPSNPCDFPIAAGTAGTAREKIVVVGWGRGGEGGGGGQLSKLDGIVRYRAGEICEPLLRAIYRSNGEWMMGCWGGRSAWVAFGATRRGCY